MERKEKMKRKDMHVNEHERLSIKTYLYIEISGTYRVYNDTLIILKKSTIHKRFFQHLKICKDLRNMVCFNGNRIKKCFHRNKN
jgi:hypothetical protein